MTCKLHPWYLLESGVGSYAFNMALDEALLEAMPRLGKPVLRFYSWSERAASFGYFQKYAEIERLTLLRPLVRRPTGGGLVMTEEIRSGAERERKSVLDSYGATDPAEFFAVATEAFFEKPLKLQQKHPELYQELKNFYRQDPARWPQVGQ